MPDDTVDREETLHLVIRSLHLRIAAQNARIEQLTTALRTYGRHSPDCTALRDGLTMDFRQTVPCSCGLDAALTKKPPHEDASPGTPKGE